MYFSSKKDLWMTIILWTCALLLIIPPIFFPDLGVWMTPNLLDKQWVKMIILIPLGIGTLWICFKTGYKIDHHVLTIHFGPYKKKIKIEDIFSIREVKSPFSTPALSMDRIEINYNQYKTVSISPKDKKEFIEKLLKENQNIKVETY